MSGFVVVANLNGAPTDPKLVGRLTDALAFRGPDAKHYWMDQEVGLGHALFRTANASGRERQPCSLAGEVWITGDIRLDARSDLIRALEREGLAQLNPATDAELVLYAYQVWGEALVDKLLGDFAFAIWDSPEKRLFCARDHLGVKPLFYSRVGQQLVVSNTMSCIQVHGSVSDDLNDAAIGDFLIFGSNWDPRTTSYADIQRLPGAHVLSWCAGGEPDVRRYWTLPRFNELRLRRRADYVDRFCTLVETATTDRLGAAAVGVQMSGGRDSSMIAGVAHRLMAKVGAPSEVRAHTIVFDRLIKDEERHYAGLVASHLGIPIEFLVADSYPLFQGEGKGALRFPEPVDTYAQALLVDDFNRQIAARSRVALTGLDGDSLLSADSTEHFTNLWRGRELGRVPADALRYAVAKCDPLAAILRRLRQSGRRGAAPPSSLGWINPSFAQRLCLKDRTAYFQAQAKARKGARESAYRALAHPNWLPTLEGLDAGATGVALERRHPLLDLRVVQFLLSLPAVPWCVDKHIFRASAHDLLPRPVLSRPKTPLASDPLQHLLREYVARSGNFGFHPAVWQFIDERMLRRLIDEADTEAYWLVLRAMILSHWLWVREGLQK